MWFTFLLYIIFKNQEFWERVFHYKAEFFLYHDFLKWVYQNIKPLTTLHKNVLGTLVKQKNNLLLLLLLLLSMEEII